MLAVSDLAVSWEVWPPHPLPAAFSWEDSGEGDNLTAGYWVLGENIEQRQGNLP